MGQSASVGQGTVGADELKVTGNGSSGQVLSSDGDGTFSWSTDLAGNSGTATALATARAINGVDFDGSAAITVTAAAGTLSGTELKSTVVTSSLTSVGTLTALTGGTGDFNWDSNTLVVDSSANAVGIGIALPTSPLHIDATKQGWLAQFKNTGTGNDANGLFLQSSDNATEYILAVQTLAGSSCMVVKGDGNVGIGTSAPTARLEIEDAGHSSPLLKVTADDGNPYAIVVGNDTYSTNDAHGMAFLVSDAGVGYVTMDGSGSKLSLGTGGSTKMLIDNSGNVGIGATVPRTKLEIVQDDFGADKGLRIAKTLSEYWDFSIGADSGNRFDISNYNVGTPVISMNNSGNVGIGCTPTTKFEVDTGAGSGNNVMIGQSSATNYNCISLNGSVTNTASQGLLGGADGGDLYIDTAGTTPTIYFRIGGATHMAIQNGGNVEIGTGSAEHLLEFKCSTHQSANDERIRFTNNGYNRGGLYTGSNTTPTPYLSSSSDYRLKKNIVDYGDGLLDKINSLKLRKWNPVEDENIECRGLVAHELAEIFPNYVMGEKDAVDDDGNPVYQSIGEGLLVLDLLGAIQELSAKVEALENA